MEDRLLTHSASDESLFDDLKHVVTAPKPLLSHLVGSRTKEDREELKRILTHLPAIRECRTTRALRKTGKSAGPDIFTVPDATSPQKDPTLSGVTPRSLTTPRSPSGAQRPASTGGQVTSRLGTPRGAATPRSGGTPRAAVYTPRPQTTPPGVTPRSQGNTPRLTGIEVAGSYAMKAPLPPPSALSGGDVRPSSEPAPPSSSAERTAATMRKAMELRGEKQARKPEEEKKSQAEATQRVIEKLAELGIDPEGMSATDILRIFYARGSGSSYWLANREAEKRLNIRASTPKSFCDVLKPRAEREIRRARDLPVTNVHEYLDQWEIAFLGDICRSLRCFDEAAEGPNSEYSKSYTKRQYGTQSGRKKFVRPPT